MFFFENEFKKDEKVVYGLKRVYGMGLAKSLKICNKLGVSEKARFGDIDNEIARGIMQESMKAGKLMIDLKGQVIQNIQRNIEIRNYKGVRYSNGLPLRGQRTKTNGRTAKKLLRKAR